MRLCLTFARLSSTSELTHIRSLLFAPGNDDAKLRKALDAGADAVVADLEDAVAAVDKPEARAVVQRLYSGTVPATEVSRVVRVNGVETAYFQDDLALVSELELDAIRAAFESQDSGVLALDGSMIDKPIVDRARRVFAEAKGATP